MVGGWAPIFTAVGTRSHLSVINPWTWTRVRRRFNREGTRFVGFSSWVGGRRPN